MRPIHTIVVHHSGTPASWTWETVWRFHTEARGWDDGGYHYLVEAEGRVRLGRHPDIQGAHVKDHNEGTLGVCVVGDFSARPVPGLQWGAAVSLVTDLLRQYGLQVSDVKGHRELASGTVCPGYSPQEFRAAVRAVQARNAQRRRQPWSLEAG